MKGLKCTTANCEYNEGCHCKAGIINIGSNGVCESKIKRENGVMEQEFINMEVASEFSYEDNDDVLIECDSTKCIYNHAHRCNSDIVTVSDSIIKTKCKTKKTTHSD